MKTIYLLACLSLVNSVLIAQPKGPPGGRPPIELADNTGAFMGRVLDAQTGEAILLANVLVYTTGTDELISGNTTNERGLFIVKGLPYGEYDIEVSFLGYETQRREQLRVSADARMVRTGKFGLTSASADLEQVEVTAERAAVQFGLDRRVFNVEKDVASSGGTAEDLLRNIPSVTVDLDGNISLRGSQNVRILINGKPSTLAGLDRQGFLQQLAAANIQSIEVLTNPGAKYDPEGMGGIINIITKQQNRQGFNVLGSINIGTNNKYNANAGFNYRVGKFNWQANYSFNDDERWFRGQRYRGTETADTTWYLYQDINGDRFRQSHRLRLGLEYFLSSRASLELKGNRGWEDGNDRSSRDNSFFSINQTPLFDSFRGEIGTETEEDWEVNLDYRQRFREEGRLLDISVQYSEEAENEEERFEEIFTLPGPDGERLDIDQQRNPQPQRDDFWLAQVNYEQPLGEAFKLEAGSRVTLRGLYSDNEFYDYNPNTDEFELVTSLSNEFEYQEDVFAGYGTLSNKSERWEWQLGIRAEQTMTEARLLEPVLDAFPNDYFSLFPSAFLTHKIDDNTSVQANYSRRINRPRFRALNPFVDQSDPLNPRGGNPFLLPEFINSYELTYLRSSDIGSLSIGGYLRQINDMITRVIQPDPATGVNLRTFANLNSGRNYGLEVIGTLRPSKKMRLVLSGNAFRTELEGNNAESDLNAAGYQFSGRLQANYTLGKDLGAQLTGFYRSPGIRPQGEMRALYSMDIGLRKPVLKGKGNITFRVTDIFNTRRWRFFNESLGISDDAEFQRESRIAYLGFNYSLRQDKSSRRRDRGNRGMNGGGDVDF